MDPEGVLRGRDTRRNELAAEEVAEEGRSSVLVVVAMVVVDQAVIHIDKEDCMTGKNCTEKAIAELGVVEHFDKVMDVVAVVEGHCMMNYHRKIEDHSANTVAEVEKPVCPSHS